jgi:hypothetical protein
VLRIEVLAAGLAAGDVGLEGLELGLRGRRTLLRLADLGGQPLDLLLPRLDPAPARGDLAGEPRQALAAVRGGTQQGADPALLLGLGLLGLVPGVDGVREVFARHPDRVGQGRLLFAHRTRLRGELLGVPARRAGPLGSALAHVGEQPPAVGRE